MQNSGDEKDTSVLQKDEPETMVNITTPKASDNVVIKEVRTTVLGSLGLSEEQTSVSGGINSKSVSESTEDSSLTEKEMSVLDVIKKSGDQSDGKDTAMASSTGEAQAEVSVMQGTHAMDTSPVLSDGTKKGELCSSGVRTTQFPAPIHVKVEEFPSQTPTEDEQFPIIKTCIKEEDYLARTPGMNEELSAQTFTDTDEVLILTPPCEDEFDQTRVETEESSFQVHIEKNGYPVQTHLIEAKLPAPTCIVEELPSQTQIEKIEFPIPTCIKEKVCLSEKEGLPLQILTVTEEGLVLTLTMKEEPAQTAIQNRELFAQSQTVMEVFSSQVRLHEAKRPAQTHAEEDVFPVEKDEFPVQTHAEETSCQKHTNEHESKEEIKLPVKEAERDLVVGENRSLTEHADGKESAFEEGLESGVLQQVEEENPAGHENSTAILSNTVEEEKFESEYGQKNEYKEEAVLQEVMEMKQEVNTVSSTLL